MSEPLIDEVAAVVAPGYRELPLEDAAGILLVQMWGDELAPFALELTEVHDDVMPDGYQEELGAPDLGEEAPFDELRARVQEDEGLLNAYLLTLAARVHELVGIPVLVHEIEMPIAEQRRRQSKSAPQEDALAGMDVLVRVEIDEHRTAAVTLREGLWMYASARAGDPDEAHPIGPGLTEIGVDPHVVAGMLPGGATGVRVQDRKGTWHAAATGRGGWLCVLPQRSRGQEEPPFEYQDASGNAFAPGEDAWVIEQPPSLQEHEATVRESALVPAIFIPGGGAIFEGWDGPRGRATGLRYVHGEWDVHTTLEPVTPAAAFEERLIRVHGYNTAGARKRLRSITPERLPGTLDGNPITLELMAFPESWDRSRGWVAVLRTDAYTVTVQCGGVPPDHVDLRTH